MAVLIWLVMSAMLQLTMGLSVVFEWKSLLSRYPDADNGHVVREYGIPFSLEVWHDMVFLAVPRWHSGVASSLSYVQLPEGDSPDKSPRLRPYPNWSWHNMHALVRDSDALQNLLISPFRVRADVCNRLWVLDSGVADILGSAERIAPTRLLIFSLETLDLLRLTALNDDVITKESFHVNFVVDASAKRCEEAYAYIADIGDPGLVVYNFANDTFWRITDPLLDTDLYKSESISTYFAGPLTSLALSTPVEGDPVLYLEHGELSVSTAALKTMDEESLQLIGNTNNGVSGVSDMDKWTDILFYTQMTENAVSCCNMMRNCTSDTEGLINTTLFASDIRLDQHGNLWVLETRTPLFDYTPLVPDIVNYRITSGPVEKVAKDLPCFTGDRKHFGDNGAATKNLHISVLLYSIVILIGIEGLFNT